MLPLIVGGLGLAGLGAYGYHEATRPLEEYNGKKYTNSPAQNFFQGNKPGVYSVDQVNQFQLREDEAEAAEKRLRGEAALQRELSAKDLAEEFKLQEQYFGKYMTTPDQQMAFAKSNNADKAKYAMNLLNRQGELGAEQQIRGFEQDNVTNALKIGQRRDDRMAQMGMDTFGQLDNSGNQLLRNATDLMRNYNVSKWF